MAIKKIQFLPLIICLLIPLTIGAIGGFFTFEAVNTWYTTLNKPTFNPPNNIFGPVWTTLYVLMGVASYLIWQRRKTAIGYHWALFIYLLQLLLNLMWSFLFFRQHQIGVALVEIGVLLIILIFNAIICYRIHKIAGLLFVPYILWVSFASYLTYSIYILN